ncbi:MAG: metallophosphoesterase [Clostridia bacterium]|nr:metallophosphoesterase [Clostridia bacterium]
MAFDPNFKPVLRFMVVSDVHYRDEHSVERDRMELAIKTAYRLSEAEEYSALDALYVVGDFATSGSRTQMLAFKDTLDKNLKKETEVTLSMASHEFHGEGEEAALEKFREIYSQEPDTHKVINGYHFISVTCTNGCHFDDEKRAWVSAELKKAAADNPRKPIFFFQHPHIMGTVYGSANWGEDELTDILMNYPQIIDFSGHSHAPINDPRSIHQRHFTCLGTGTLSYFELDEFDKFCSTIPPEKEKAAQMLIVEADADMRVRVYPYDLITENFFPMTWKIDSAWDVKSYLYTDKRYKTEVAPYFDDDAKIVISDVTEDGFKVTFDQAKTEDVYVDDYNVIVKNSDGVTVRNTTIWSEYYFYEMSETLSVEFKELSPNETYYVEIYAGSFWKTISEKPLVSKKIEL